MRRTETVIAVLGLALLAAVGAAAALLQSTPPAPYASTSTAPDGTLALYRWVAALGYQPRRLTTSPRLEPRLRALFVLEPQAAFSAEEAARALRWVRDGGTLVLLEDAGDARLLGTFGLTVSPLPAAPALSIASSGGAPYGAAPVQPLLAHPPLRGLSTQVTASVAGNRAAVVLLGNGGLTPPGPRRAAPSVPDAGHPVLVYEQIGHGRIYAGTTPGVVTNDQLPTGDNRLLVLNLLAGLPAGAAIGFDDYHLVAPVPVPATLEGALAGTWWGRALLYALLLAAAYVVLTGRRLGRPLTPLPERGRSLAEYVVSMAAIFRRAGLRGRVLALWQNDLRRHLAGPGRAAGRSDGELVTEAAHRAGLTPAEQDEALALLQPRETLSESTLVEQCRRIARLQQRLAMQPAASSAVAGEDVPEKEAMWRRAG